MNNHLACGCTVEPQIKDTIDKANDTLCGWSQHVQYSEVPLYILAWYSLLRLCLCAGVGWDGEEGEEHHRQGLNHHKRRS